VVLGEELCILASCCLSPMRRNSVLGDLKVSRLAVIHEVGELDWIGNQVGEKRGRFVCHLR